MIVDLGGSTPHLEEGALYLMGYEPWASRLIIVDLPPEDRFNEWKKTADSERKIVKHDKGVVEYAYGSIGDLSFIEEDGFADMVWSGNSIEHIPEDEADVMVEQVFRILKPGGSFCLDTPNRRVTKEIFSKDYCHIDHKIEYTDESLSAKLEKHGFVIKKRLGLLDCSRLFEKKQEFTLRFQMDCPNITEKIEDGFILYYECVKPE